MRAQQRQYRLRNPDKVRAWNERYSLSLSAEKKESKKRKSREWARSHPEQQLTWISQNPERRREIARLSARRRRAASPVSAINHRMSTAVRLAVKGLKSGRRWETLVGYTVHDLKRHIESNFKQGMTWTKLISGEIHIDHVIPKSKFVFGSDSDLSFRRCWSLENLKPEWKPHNLSKGAKILAPSQIALGI